MHEDVGAKNVVVFGLSEDKSEDLDSKLVELFEEIEEKPSFEAARIGMVSTEKNRPVRFSPFHPATVKLFIGFCESKETESLCGLSERVHLTRKIA